jgi:hypothetical protein
MDSLDEKRLEVQLSTSETLIYHIVADTSLCSFRYIKLTNYPGSKWLENQELVGYDYWSSLDSVVLNLDKAKTSSSINHDVLTGRIYTFSDHWLHPPRSDYFRILELNAFPYYKIGLNQWNFSLEINNHEHWSDERWVVWEGTIESESKYSVVGSAKYLVGGVELPCYKIQASTTINGIGETSSIFLYHLKYGFVYMSFTTINGEVIEMSMI